MLRIFLKTILLLVLAVNTHKASAVSFACIKKDKVTVPCRDFIVNNESIDIDISLVSGISGDGNLWITIENPSNPGATPLLCTFIAEQLVSGPGTQYIKRYHLTVWKYNYGTSDPCDVQVVTNPAFTYLNNIAVQQGVLNCDLPLYAAERFSQPGPPASVNEYFFFNDMGCCSDAPESAFASGATSACLEVNRDGVQQFKVTVPNSVAQQFPISCSTPAHSGPYTQPPAVLFLNGNTWVPVQASCRTQLPGGDWEYYYPLVNYSVFMRCYPLAFTYEVNTGIQPDYRSYPIVQKLTACPCCTNANFTVKGSTAMPLSITFTPVSPDPALTTLWNFGNGITATGSYGVSHNYGAFGSYTACLRTSAESGIRCNSCAPLCLTEPSHFATNGTCNTNFSYMYTSYNGNLTLMADNPNQNASYTWTIGGSVIANGPGISYLNPPVSGSPLSVCLKVGTCETCTEICLPGKGRSKDGGLRLAGEEQTVPAISVYPNPVTSELTIEANSVAQGMLSVRIVDLMGHLLHEERKPLQPGINQLKLMIDHLPAGIYLIETSDGVTKRRERVSKL